MWQVWDIDLWHVQLIELNCNLHEEEFYGDASLYVGEIIKSYFMGIWIFILFTDVVPVPLCS